MASGGPPDKLNPQHKLAALLEARGELNNNEIAEAVNLSPVRVSILRNNSPQYKLLVEKYRAELVDRTLEESAKLLAEFNEAALDAFKSLKAIHTDTGAREGARVAAAKEILDRASVAPQKRTDDSGKDAGIHIHLGSQSMANIRCALEDVEDYEVIDLLESDYTELEGAPEQIGEDGPIEAKEAP